MGRTSGCNRRWRHRVGSVRRALRGAAAYRDWYCADSARPGWARRGARARRRARRSTGGAGRARRGGGHVEARGLPIVAIVEADENGKLGGGEEQPLADRVFADRVDGTIGQTADGLLTGDRKST